MIRRASRPLRRRRSKLVFPLALAYLAAPNDHTTGICIWEGESVDAVRDLAESVVGAFSANEYFEMHVDGLTAQV